MHGPAPAPPPEPAAPSQSACTTALATRGLGLTCWLDVRHLAAHLAIGELPRSSHTRIPHGVRRPLSFRVTLTTPRRVPLSMAPQDLRGPSAQRDLGSVDFVDSSIGRLVPGGGRGRRPRASPPRPWLGSRSGIDVGRDPAPDRSLRPPPGGLGPRPRGSPASTRRVGPRICPRQPFGLSAFGQTT